jgi:hypothetical protein
MTFVTFVTVGDSQRGNRKKPDQGTQCQFHFHINTYWVFFLCSDFGIGLRVWDWDTHG